MAIYHQSVKPVQRSKGRSATAAAAYRSGERVRCEREGVVHDYTRRSGVEHTELVGWSGDRESLWNAAESAERRKDGTPAREYEIGLPRELDRAGRIELAREYAGWLAERHGVAVDIAVHGHDSANPHAHLLATTRAVGADGASLGDKAAVEWSDKRRKQHGLPGRKAELAAAREAWQDHANRALERGHHPERIDHRSLKDQRAAALERGDQPQAEMLDREPQTKIGYAAQRMERRGQTSDRGQDHRALMGRNAERQGLYAAVRQIGGQIREAGREVGERIQSGVQSAQQRFKDWQQQRESQRQQRLQQGLEGAKQRYQAHQQQRTREREQQRQMQRQRLQERVQERTQQAARDGPGVEL